MEITQTQRYMLIGGLHRSDLLKSKLEQVREERLALRMQRVHVNRELAELMHKSKDLADQIEDLNDEEKAITAQLAAGR